MNLTRRPLVLASLFVLLGAGICIAQEYRKAHPVPDIGARFALPSHASGERRPCPNMDEPSNRLAVLERDVKNLQDMDEYQMTWLQILTPIIFATVSIVASLGFFLGYKGLKNLFHPIAEQYKKELEEYRQELQRSKDVLDVFSHDLAEHKRTVEDLRARARHQDFLLGARFQVLLLESDQVIAGADKLSILGTPETDGPYLRIAMKREGLSKDAREALQRALADLLKRATSIGSHGGTDSSEP